MSDAGELLYEFPSFQTSAKAVRPKAGVEGGFLVEDSWKFSLASKGQQVAAGALGLLNLAGVTFLSSLLRDPRVLQAAMESGSAAVSLAAGALPLLQVYAALFFAIPAVRWVTSLRTNAAIEARNAARAQQARTLASPPASLGRKLGAARSMQKREKVIQRADVVYDSSKELSDPANDVEGAEFDRMLEDREQRRRKKDKRLL